MNEVDNCRVSGDTLEIGESMFEFVDCKPDPLIFISLDKDVFKKEEALLLRDFINEKFGGNSE